MLTDAQTNNTELRPSLNPMPNKKKEGRKLSQVTEIMSTSDLDQKEVTADPEESDPDQKERALIQKEHNRNQKELSQRQGHQMRSTMCHQMNHPLCG